MNAVQQSIAMLGGPSKVAAKLGVTTQAVCFWRDGLREFPAERCPAIERATNGAVRCEDLHPDIDWAVLRCNCKDAA